MLLLVIRYGHIWRERANSRYGYDTKAEDEKNESPPAPGPVEEVEDDEPRELPRDVSRIVSRDVRPRSGSRNAKERDMPEVKDVLRRTTSLSGASVHGGG